MFLMEVFAEDDNVNVRCNGVNINRLISEGQNNINKKTDKEPIIAQWHDALSASFRSIFTQTYLIKQLYILRLI